MEIEDGGLNHVVANSDRELISLSSFQETSAAGHVGPATHGQHGQKENENDCESETDHFNDVCSAYRQYANFAMAQWANHAYRFQSLPESQRRVLPPHLLFDTNEYMQSMTEYKEAVIRNQFCLDCILRHAGQAHSQQVPRSEDVTSVTDEQISKLSSVLKSLARDWSVEGKVERDMAYLPIIRDIQKYVPVVHRGGAYPPNNATNPPPPPQPPRVCVPGSGLGRLAFELIRLGYTVQGNDFSLYMLLASDFILNNGMFTPTRPLSISPWLYESRNILSRKDPLESVQIPDLDPYEALLSSSSESPLLAGPNFSVAAGDFCSIYSHPKEVGQWDVVASCFFLDACPSLIEALQVIYRMLRPGGILINLGPLLYHWSGPVLRPNDKSLEEYRQRYSHLDERYLSSVDLCYDDVKVVMKNIGFEILDEVIGIECLYTSHHKSMMSTMYRCVSFVAKKKM
jgi:carnosine N-methyltransferase